MELRGRCYQRGDELKEEQAICSRLRMCEQQVQYAEDMCAQKAIENDRLRTDKAAMDFKQVQGKADRQAQELSWLRQEYEELTLERDRLRYGAVSGQSELDASSAG